MGVWTEEWCEKQDWDYYHAEPTDQGRLYTKKEFQEAKKAMLAIMDVWDKSNKALLEDDDFQIDELSFEDKL